MEEIPYVDFCGIGADHALEHLNRAMKVAGGLVGLTLNENARVCFFLTALRLKCPADEAKTMASVKTKSTEKHHSLSAQITSRQLKYTESMIPTFNNLTNPFSYEGVDLIKLLTKSMMEESIMEDMKWQDKIEKTRLSYSVQKESGQALLVFGLQSKKQNLRHSKLHENESKSSTLLPN